ncbi:MAG: SDR family oxidoreductase [Verrucomicrobiae bacterium]|nr:SDR family oxidoreductase [Verrucomicrobiae bacterium]
MPISPPASPAEFGPDDLYPGLSAEFERALDQEDIDRFAEVSGDFNPLHIDPAYANQSNYQDTLVHGAFQVGMASALIGMHLPGRNVLLGGVSAKFLAPLHVPSTVRVSGEITAWNRANLSGQLRVTLFRLPDMAPVSEISMAFTLHCNNHRNETYEKPRDLSVSSPRQTVLVTGASGGVGSFLATRLSEHYEIVATHRSNSLPNSLLSNRSVHPVKVDFNDSDDLTRLRNLVLATPLSGIVHCAWPSAPQGGLMAVNPTTLANQLSAGSRQLIDLAHLLEKSKRTSDGGRLILIGSIYGRQSPKINLGAYSLGKDLMESTARLLAPELAAKNITVNVIAPSMIEIGMNKHTDQRSVLREKSQIPMGRLCTLEDVHNAVSFLLSPESEFISGQVMGLTGARI